MTDNPPLVSILHPTAPLCLIPLKPENPLLDFFQRVKPCFCRVGCLAVQSWGETLEAGVGLTAFKQSFFFFNLRATLALLLLSLQVLNPSGILQNKLVCFLLVSYLIGYW